MATFLDIGLFQHISIVFPILLVFVLVFAILEKTKALGENKGLHAIIALCLAMMMLFVPNVVDVIGTMAPWFILLALFIFFMVVLLLTMGTPMSKITEYASKDFGVAHWFLLIILIIVFLGAIGAVYGNALLPYSGGRVTEQPNVSSADDTGLETGQTTDTGDFNANVGKVIFHPKVLGFLLVLVIGSISIKLLTGPAFKP